MSLIGMAIRFILAGVVMLGWNWIFGPPMVHPADSSAVRGVPPIRHSTAPDHAQSVTTRISADDFTYLGAFRLPGHQKPHHDCQHPARGPAGSVVAAVG